MKSAPNKRTFDLVLIVVLFAHPAFGLVKMAARRWAREGAGAQAMVGESLGVLL